MKRSTIARLAAALVAGTTVVAAGAFAAAPSSLAAAAHPATVRVRPAITGHIQPTARVAPLPPWQCVALTGIHCYSPLQYRLAYNLNPLYAKGITGAGRTILIVDSFGSPTIQHDLEAFDAQWGLPNTTVQVVQAGTIPPFDPKNPDHVGWAQETTLDVEYAHAIAPGAHIVLVETPVAETEGVTGFPEMMNAEKALIDKGVGDVISQSSAATENTFPGFDQGDFSSLLNLRYAFKDAALHGVTVLASSGDAGATDFIADGSALYPFPVNSWPSSDPLVTSIGGTQMTLHDDGPRRDNSLAGVTGYPAGPGYDLGGGWGTIVANQFVPALARL